MFQNKFRLMLVGLLLLGLAVSNIFAQFAPDGKTISEMARKASYDNSVTAEGEGIKGKFTPAKVGSDQLKNLSNGILIGLLELEVTNTDYDKVRTGKFDLFLTKEKKGLRLYLEEKEIIAAVLEVSDQTPEGYTATKDSKALAFPNPDDNGKISLNFAPTFNRPLLLFASFEPLKKTKYYFKIKINGTTYYIEAGSKTSSKKGKK